MRQIQLIGPVDKRPIAYPLFKLCDTMGKTLVVTDDANFRRFADNYETEFTLGRSDFYILHNASREAMEEKGVKLTSYDYVIFITTNTLVNENDCVVYCHGNSQMVCSEDVLDIMETVEHTNITITTQKPKKEKGVESEIFLSADSKTFAYIWECEESKFFVGCKHPDLAKLCTHLFAGVLGVSGEEIPKILVKEV